MKTTVLKYLEDTYLFSASAQVVDSGKNEFGEYIILDSTIFYPQGGGQPTDTGDIISGENCFHVSMVRLDENGVVYHYGTPSESGKKLESGFRVEINIDSDNRIKNAKNHTAGHLIDIAQKNIGLILTPTKGYHFQNGSYVEYSGTIENLEQERENIISKLSKELEKLISQDIKVVIENGESDISNPNAPQGKSYRFVYFDGYKDDGCGCGGTHINSTGEFGEIIIRKLRVKKGVIKMSYEVQ